MCSGTYLPKNYKTTKKMTKCGICELAVSDEIRCSQCVVELHEACVDWVDTVNQRSIVCPKCKGNTMSMDIVPIEYSPNTSAGPDLGTNEPLARSSPSGLDRELFCILFPGIVKNDDKAIQCLGGIKGISQVYGQPLKKRLGLSFQPENPFVKKVYADFKKTAGVLLKIKVKKVKKGTEVKKEIISTDVVGRVNSIYRFESMCDFQYMPVYREASNEPLQCLMDKIIPTGTDNINFLKGESPLFVVPANFTRSDRPISYAYTDKRYPDRSGSPYDDSEFHNKSRSDRGMPLGHWWRFSSTEDFPSQPNEYYITNRDAKYEYNPALRKEFEIIHKCFQERPIWSLNMIKYQTKLRLGSLKVLVPCVGVFMRDGPWKSLWVKYGFDPRKETSARIYQTLDFRLRHAAGVHSMVMTRDQIVHYKSADRVRQLKRKNRTEPLPSEDVSEGAVLFRPGMVPTQRQIFYQLCDVKIPEVEAILAPEPPPGSVCHAKLGWLPPNAIETCRDHIFKYVKQTLLASHSADLKFDDGDGGSSDEDSQGSGDDITNEMDGSMQ